MRLKEGFRLRNLCREYIVVAEGLQQVNFNKMIALNATAAYLWQKVEGKEFTVQDLADLLTAEYDVDAETALKDSEAIAQKWMEAGIAE